jgi:hypothetical protein
VREDGNGEVRNVIAHKLMLNTFPRFLSK